MTIAGLLPAIVIRRYVNDCRILSDLANFVSLILGFFVICRFLSVLGVAGGLCYWCGVDGFVFVTGN